MSCIDLSNVFTSVFIGSLPEDELGMEGCEVKSIL